MSARVPVRASTPDERKAAKRAAAAAFKRAVAACDYSLDEVAALFGVSRSRARKMLSDAAEDLDVVPSAADIVLADHELGERFLVELRAERLRIHGAPPVVTLEQQAHATVAADARVTCALAIALGNGVIEGHERPGIESALRDSERERDRLAGMLRTGARS